MKYKNNSGTLDFLLSFVNKHRRNECQIVNEMGKDFFEHRIYSAVIIELRDSEGLGVFWYQSELTLPLAC